jgi:hypothetical protein
MVERTLLGPGGATDAKLEAVRALLAGTLGVTVGNDPASIALTAATASDLTSSVPLVISPASGNAIRLWWVMATPDPDNDNSGYVTVNLAPHGDIYVLDVVAHRQRFDGGTNEDVTVSVTGAGAYRATVHYEEFTP